MRTSSARSPPCSPSGRPSSPRSACGVRRTAKLAKWLRAALDEERSTYVDDARLLFAVGAATGLNAPSVRTTTGVSDPHSVRTLTDVAPVQGCAAFLRQPAERRAPYWAAAFVLTLMLLALAPLLALGGTMGNGSTDAVLLSAFGPVEEPVSPDASVRRIAVSLAVTNRSSTVVFVSPLQFRARDSKSAYHRPTLDATLDVERYRLVASGPGSGGAMGSIALRGGDLAAGYVVFDVPQGTQLTHIVLTAGGHELIVEVPADRYSLAAPSVGRP